MKTITADGEIVDTACEDCAPIPIPAPFFKTPFNHDRDVESARTGLLCLDKSKTQQQFAAEADINNILAKFQNTGELNLVGTPVYQDAEQLFDLQDNMVTAHQVEEAWNALPTAVRNILKDPKTFADYIDHCVKAGDLEPLRELGLANPAPAEPPAEGAPPDPAPAVKAS